MSNLSHFIGSHRDVKDTRGVEKLREAIFPCKEILGRVRLKSTNCTNLEFCGATDFVGVSLYAGFELRQYTMGLGQRCWAKKVHFSS